MADQRFTTGPTTYNVISFAGGLNTNAGPFALQSNESPDLQNVDFNIFGSLLKRNGYVNVNSSALGDFNSDGLFWFEFDSSGTATRKFVNVADGKLYKMDTSVGEPDGTWDDATNGQTITADNFCDFVVWRNKLFIVNGNDTPLVWDGAGTTSLTTGILPTNVTKPVFIEQFNNYLFYLNVNVSGAAQGSRYYWSDLGDETTWSTISFDVIGDRDGTNITGAKALGDRLVIFKDRNVYNVFFTGDRNIPFIEEKSSSPVGCINGGGYAIAEVEGGLVFPSQDGFYFYDGNTSVKISDRIQPTFDSLDISSARSIVQKNKNRYMCAATDSSNNDVLLIWDYQLNAWTKYTGLNASAMVIAYINGIEERPYFMDYKGYLYRLDTGSSDYPLGVQTAINSYYYTNWISFGDMMLKKAPRRMVFYHTLQDTNLTISYNYNFQDTDDYSETRNLGGNNPAYFDEALFDVDNFVGSGGFFNSIDVSGRGLVVRFKFANAVTNETFRIDGLAVYPQAETYR